MIIAGPTASGKSALALGLAAAFGGTIINADALQVYRDLPILTAWPDAEARARVPHRLYGFSMPSERGSAGRWREAALGEIAAAHRAGRLPFVVGGTGLYLRCAAARSRRDPADSAGDPRRGSCPCTANWAARSFARDWQRSTPRRHRSCPPATGSG